MNDPEYQRRIAMLLRNMREPPWRRTLRFTCLGFVVPALVFHLAGLPRPFALRVVDLISLIVGLVLSVGK